MKYQLWYHKPAKPFSFLLQADMRKIRRLFEIIYLDPRQNLVISCFLYDFTLLWTVIFSVLNMLSFLTFH